MKNETKKKKKPNKTTTRKTKHTLRKISKASHYQWLYKTDSENVSDFLLNASTDRILKT